jgi:arylsulfatase A-like enzyme
MPHKDGACALDGLFGGSMNVVVLVCDALRAPNLGCYGYDKDTSPEIDRIAERGIRFSNAFATANSTDASFTTIFTGKYPSSHGICHQASKVTETEKSYTTNLVFLPELLRQNGFATVGIDWLGRWHKWGYDYYAGVRNYSHRNEQTQPAAAQKRSSAPRLSALRKLLPTMSLIRSRCNWYYSLPSSARKSIRTVLQFCDRKLDNDLSGRKSRPIVTDSAALTNLAIDYIQKFAGQQNLFLFVHYWDTHTPYTAPRSIVKEFLRKYKYSNAKTSRILEDLSGTKSGHIVEKAIRGKIPETVGEVVAHYDASIRYVDANIGRLYRFLEETSMLDDTLLLVTGDHGESLTEHGIFFNHHGLYDPQVKVPFIMSRAGLQRGRVYDELVQHFDLVPTVLESVGIHDTHTEFDGMSLLQLVQGRHWSRRFVFAEETLLQQKRMIRDKRYKYIQVLNDEPCLYCERYHSKGDEFYDVQADPEEKNNIIGDAKHRDYKDELEKYINTLAKPKEGQEATFQDEEEINRRLQALGYL